MLGEHGCYPLMAVSFLKEKAAWQMYASVNGVTPKQANEVSKGIDKYNKTLIHTADEEKDSIKPEQFIPAEYIDIYKKSKSYQGMIANVLKHACFPAGTNILTSQGLKDIKDFVGGEYVLTHNNTYQVVRFVHQKQTNELIVLKSGGQELCCTPNHKIYTRKAINKFNGPLSEPQWVRADKINEKHYIGMPINQRAYNHFINCNLPINNPDFWWIVGRWIGDGWVEKVKNRPEKRLIICCGKQNDELNLEMITQHLDSLFDYRVEENRTVYKFFIKNVEFYYWLQQFGKYAEGKMIPGEVLDLPVDLLRQFLEGYLSADGCYDSKTGKVSFSSVSKNLVYMLREIIHKVYHAPVYIYERKAQDYIIEGRTAHGKNQYRGVFKTDVRQKDQARYEAGYIWFRVTETQKISDLENCLVFDLSVVGDNSYTANGFAVHNCGHLMFDGDIRREIGLMSALSEATGERTLVAAAEGKYLDSFGYVKEDFLIVDSVALTYKLYASIGQDVPSFEELKELVKGDKETWEIYEKGITCCINQCEKLATTQKAMRYKPKNIAELSAFIAGIRPGAASIVDDLLDRRYYTTGEKVIDDLLEDSAHFMLYQESIMKILAFLGVDMGETYSVIKKIAKYLAL